MGNTYECIYCSEKIPENDKARHESFHCKVLMASSGLYDAMRNNSSNMYECIHCSEKMPENNKSMHQSFHCKVLRANSGLNNYDSESYTKVTKIPKRTKYKIEPRSANCRFCEKTLDAGMLKFHECDCIYRPVECPDCFKEILKKDINLHRCKRRKEVSREAKAEDAHGRKDGHPLEDTSGLSEHLKNLLLTGDGHDVLLNVGDKQFGVHKHILRARSPVFAAMFTSQMAERAEGSVTIEDCDPEAFADFLEFVYTGKVDFASVGRALGLYDAGDKYDFPRLKEMCVEFLKNSFTTTTIFKVVNLADTHNEQVLLQKAMDYLSTHLEDVMVTVEWKRFITANPVQANDMCFRALQWKKR